MLHVEVIHAQSARSFSKGLNKGHEWSSVIDDGNVIIEVKPSVGQEDECWHIVFYQNDSAKTLISEWWMDCKVYILLSNLSMNCKVRLKFMPLRV